MVTDHFYTNPPRLSFRIGIMSKRLSIVVCHYEIPREIPRTLFSLSPAFQIDLNSADYEVVVIDNGSQKLPDISEAPSWGLDIRLLRFEKPNHSPVNAINYAVSQTDSEFVCIFIDGARIASPRLVATALEGLKLFPRTVVGCRGRYLGPSFQTESVKNGYSKAVEDLALEKIDWKNNGYKLFDISVPDESAGESLLDSPSESNALFMRRTLWDEIGGYDREFESPGGGYANLELWTRATTTDNVNTLLLIGESTFHQLHGGAATNAQSSKIQDDMHDEYRKLCGQSYVRPIIRPYFYGSLYGKLLDEAKEITKPLRAYWERDQALLQLKRIENQLGYKILNFFRNKN